MEGGGGARGVMLAHGLYVCVDIVSRKSILWLGINYFRGIWYICAFNCNTINK